MAFDVLIQAAGNHFTIDIALHVGDFFGPFIDQQHDQLDFRIIRGNPMADVLQHDRLAAARRCHDQGALAFAQGSQQIHDAGGQRLGAGLQLEPLLGVDGSQLIESLDLGIVFRRHAVDILDNAEPGSLLAAGALDIPAIIRPARKPYFSIIVPGTNGSVRSRE